MDSRRERPRPEAARPTRLSVAIRPEHCPLHDNDVAAAILSRRRRVFRDQQGRGEARLFAPDRGESHGDVVMSMKFKFAGAALVAVLGLGACLERPRPRRGKWITWP